MPALAVSEYVTWGGTLAVLAFFGLLAYRATRTRPQDVEAEEATRAEDEAGARGDQGAERSIVHEPRTPGGPSAP